MSNSYRFSLGEFSGALADLGVMLPLSLALITLNGMDAIAVFVGIGLAYFLAAVVYRLPIPVQPLKSVSAVALALGLAPAVIITGATIYLAKIAAPGSHLGAALARTVVVSHSANPTQPGQFDLRSCRCSAGIFRRETGFAIIGNVYMIVRQF
jgi:hypothetical protein